MLKFMIGFAIAAVLFAFTVELIRWIFGINDIIAELKRTNELLRRLLQK